MDDIKPGPDNMNPEVDNHEEEWMEATVFSLTDEEGNEFHFEYLDEVEKEGKTYWIAQRVEVKGDEVFPYEEDDEDKEEGSVSLFIFLKEDDEEGNAVLSELDSEEELQAVAEAWESENDEE
ncbi:MAG TPA: DUF1292 domain-containing protein [Thermotogota bacterium]|nr:DUF1292 domain-containing protein [Thermotogota bacterium]HRW92287.1 DUF1292 domain-containing protein [Thermotogota bacterium]